MLAYEKDAIKQVPRRGGVEVSLSSSSCHFLYCRFRMLQKSQVSASVFSYVFIVVSFFLLLFVMLIASCFSISWGRSDYCGPVFSLSMQSSPPTKLRIFFGISSLFPSFLMGRGQEGEFFVFGS